MPRPDFSRPELDAAEQQWWATYSDVENEYCWVQPGGIRRILRRHYVEKITQLACGRKIIELGCGTGWLSIELALAGAKHVVGYDFSEAQIKVAMEKSQELGLESSIRFRAEAGEIREKADLVVMHGFLHHLARDEIRAALRSAKSICGSEGKLVILEPVRAGSLQRRDCSTVAEYKARVARGWINALINFANRGGRWGVRRFSPSELDVRKKISERAWGTPPFGPSPKEMPFELSELEEDLRECGFTIEKSEPVMRASHLIMQEWLLRELSHPITGSWINKGIARIARNLDQLMLAGGMKYCHPQEWIFQLSVCNASN